MLSYIHTDDGTSCAPRVTGVPPRCLEHDRPVSYTPDEVWSDWAPIRLDHKLPWTPPTVESYVSLGTSLVEQAAEAAGVPLELLPKEHETSGFTLRLRELQLELVQTATQLARKHGFRPDELEVTVAMRLPAEPELITVQLGLVKPTIGDCEGCGLPYDGCRELMKDVEGRPCCRECEHLSTGPEQ